MKNIIEKLRPGDIILTSRDSMIVKFMRTFQSDPVKYGHALMVRNDRDAYESRLLTSIIPLKNIFEERKHYMVMRYMDLTDKDVEVMCKSMNSVIGTMYSFKRIVLQIFDHIFDTNYFTKLDRNKKSQVCSSLVAWAYYVATKIKFNGVEWPAVEPDDLHDHALKNTDKWQIVGEV